LQIFVSKLFGNYQPIDLKNPHHDYVEWCFGFDCFRRHIDQDKLWSCSDNSDSIFYCLS
jgi:hypothetical protein